MTYVSWSSDTSDTDLVTIQKDLNTAESQARVHLTWSPLLVPGALQTPPYAREVFKNLPKVEDQTEDIVGAVVGRMKRKDLMDRGDASYRILIGEGALRRKIGGTDVMAEQVRSLITALDERVNVGVGIVPTTAENQPVGELLVLDDRLVLMEVATGYVKTAAPADVAMATEIFQTLESQAVFGNAARELLDTVLTSYLNPN